MTKADKEGVVRGLEEARNAAGRALMRASEDSKLLMLSFSVAVGNAFDRAINAVNEAPETDE